MPFNSEENRKRVKCVQHTQHFHQICLTFGTDNSDTKPVRSYWSVADMNSFIYQSICNTFTKWQQGSKQEVRRVFALNSPSVKSAEVCITRFGGNWGKVNRYGRQSRTRTRNRTRTRTRNRDHNRTWTRTRTRTRIRNRVTIQTESLILLWVERERVLFSFIFSYEDVTISVP